MATEASIESQIVSYLRAVYPKAVIAKNVNEGKRSHYLGRSLQRQGMLKGMPDLTMVHNGMAIFFEVKTANNRATPEQLDIAAKIKIAGGYWFLVRSVDDVVSAINSLGASNE